MFERLLINHVWFSMAIWAVLYTSDYYLTLLAARLYRRGAQQHIVFEGSYELTPFFQGDVNHLRRFSPRFLSMLGLSSIGILGVWWLAVHQSCAPNLFVFLMGYFLLLEVAVHMRHLRNLYLFHYARKPARLKGRIEYSKDLSLRLSAVELIGFATLFLLVYSISGSHLFLGGVTACLLTALSHWSWAKKKGSPRLNPPE